MSTYPRATSDIALSLPFNISSKRQNLLTLASEADTLNKEEDKQDKLVQALSLRQRNKETRTEVPFGCYHICIN